MFVFDHNRYFQLVALFVYRGHARQSLAFGLDG
jgi:hypothetical protein